MDAPMINIHKSLRMCCERSRIAFLAVRTDRPRWALASGEAHAQRGRAGAYGDEEWGGPPVWETEEHLRYHLTQRYPRLPERGAGGNSRLSSHPARREGAAANR